MPSIKLTKPSGLPTSSRRRAFLSRYPNGSISQYVKYCKVIASIGKI